MSKERFGGSYLIMSNPIDKKCFIGIYDAEGKLHEIFNGSESKDFGMGKHFLIEHLKYSTESKKQRFLQGQSVYKKGFFLFHVN